MKEVHEWCKNKVEKINALVENFYNQRPDREQRPPKLDANRLILLDGRIASDLSTLRYVTRKRKNVLKELAGIVGNERTPDNAFLGQLLTCLLGIRREWHPRLGYSQTSAVPLSRFSRGLALR